VFLEFGGKLESSGDANAAIFSAMPVGVVLLLVFLLLEFNSFRRLAMVLVTVPLATTGTAGEGVAGIRYRAWQPPSALHPTIGIHSPLVFDVIDTWSGRSLGGCRYHVFHPGGKSPDTFPVNSNEAEGRRLARFEAIGHTPGTIVTPAAIPNPDYPHTLDLRRTS
jgi:uncharacterized protein (DUF2126 family)